MAGLEGQVRHAVVGSAVCSRATSTRSAITAEAVGSSPRPRRSTGGAHGVALDHDAFIEPFDVGDQPLGGQQRGLHAQLDAVVAAPRDGPAA
jgi:hypothetical protein